MKMTTVQKRHSKKWIDRIINVKSYSLANCFSGEDSTAQQIEWCIEKLNKRIKLNENKTAGTVHCHSNQWYDFDIAPA